MANECTLWVNGMIYGGWTAIRINRGIDLAGRQLYAQRYREVAGAGRSAAD